MIKNLIQVVRDFALKHYKLIFPIILVACVAVTVAVALNANSNVSVDDIIEDTTSDEQTAESGAQNALLTDVALEVNEKPEIWTLVCTYYNAVALGDLETIKSVCDTLTEMELLRYEEMAKYIELYPVLEVYTKPGPEEGSAMVYVYYKVTFADFDAEFPGYQAHYVCTAEDGSLYMKKGENTEEVNEYILAVSSQADVVDLENKIEVEYNELMQNNPQMMQYLTELDAEVGKAVGVKLAEQNALETEETAETGEDVQEGTQTQQEQPSGENTESQPQPTVMYATANTTVNVRSSDSENADKLGKVTQGTTLQVLEQGVNGWTKVSYNGQNGFIKSEYLQVLENADGMTVIGTVTVTTNLNVRSQPSTDVESLGILKKGSTAELLANENGWCKIKYDGKVGYIKAEFVR